MLRGLKMLRADEKEENERILEFGFVKIGFWVYAV